MTVQTQLKSTIILAFEKQVVSDVFALAFEGVFLASRVIACRSAAEAAKLLRDHPDACLIVEGNPQGGSLAKLFRDQAKMARRARVIVLGGDPALIPPPGPVPAQIEQLPERVAMKDLVAHVETMLMLDASTEQYCRISLKSLLVRSTTLRCDVFLKLSDGKYIKVLHANDLFDQYEYDRFVEKKVEFLYLPRADFLSLIDDLLGKMKELNAEPENVSLEDSLTAMQAVFHVVHSAFETDGFTPQIQKMTMASVSLALATIHKNPKLSDLVKRLDSNRDSYISWHSTALAFLCCKFATMLGWESDSTFYKLALASIIHDLALPSDHLARIQSLSQLEAAGLTLEERELVLRHPLEAGELVNCFEEIPGEVAFIVEQHHERQDGTGFPRGVDHNDVSPISALFIISLDIVSYMYDSPPENFRIIDFVSLREADKCYTKGAFGQVFRLLVAKVDEL